MLSPDTSKKRRRERVSLFPPKKNRPNLGNRRLNVPAVYIMPNWDIASMLLRFQGAPILTLTRLFRLCFHKEYLQKRNRSFNFTGEALKILNSGGANK